MNTSNHKASELRRAIYEAVINGAKEGLNSVEVGTTHVLTQTAYDEIEQRLESALSGVLDELYGE